VRSQRDPSWVWRVRQRTFVVVPGSSRRALLRLLPLLACRRATLGACSSTCIRDPTSTLRLPCARWALGDSVHWAGHACAADTSTLLASRSLTAWRSVRLLKRRKSRWFATFQRPDPWNTRKLSRFSMRPGISFVEFAEGGSELLQRWLTSTLRCVVAADSQPSRRLGPDLRSVQWRCDGMGFRGGALADVRRVGVGHGDTAKLCSRCVR